MSRGGSVRWQAPELFNPDDENDPSNTMESDVYAWGLVCFEIFTGQIPFRDIDNTYAVMRHVTLGGRPTRPEPLKSVPGMTEKIWSLMEQCWDVGPIKRPSSSDIVRSLSSTKKDARPNPEDGHLSSQFRREMNDDFQILDAESLRKIMHMTTLETELPTDTVTEEQDWISRDVLESTPIKGSEFSMSLLDEFFDEMDKLFGGEAFVPLIGVITTNKRIKMRMQEEDGWKKESDFDRDRNSTTGRKILTNEEVNRKRMQGPQSMSEGYTSERKKMAEEAAARKIRAAELAQNLIKKLSNVTESAIESKSWEQDCKHQAKWIVFSNSTHPALTPTSSKLKQESGSMLRSVAAKSSADIDVRWADTEGLSLEEKIKLDEKAFEIGMQIWFKTVKEDIELVIRETCDAVLKDPEISREKAQLRAVALQIMGEAFLSVGHGNLATNRRVFFSPPMSTPQAGDTDRSNQIAAMIRFLFSTF
ncbi:hypothetical protein H0H93_009717 [Arthromyces matolae]|nr:hypothetical protein H0H93_009717 [Arthromyces matolae]